VEHTTGPINTDSTSPPPHLHPPRLRPRWRQDHDHHQSGQHLLWIRNGSPDYSGSSAVIVENAVDDLNKVEGKLRFKVGFDWGTDYFYIRNVATSFLKGRDGRNDHSEQLKR
jgi:hypothetical protein